MGGGQGWHKMILESENTVSQQFGSGWQEQVASAETRLHRLEDHKGRDTILGVDMERAQGGSQELWQESEAHTREGRVLGLWTRLGDRL